MVPDVHTLNVQAAADSAGESCFWLEFVMDNRGNGGIITQTVTMLEMGKMAQAWSKHHSDTTTDQTWDERRHYTEANMFGMGRMGGSRVDHLAKTVAAMQQSSSNAEREMQQSMTRSVTVQAQPGKAVRVRFTLRAHMGFLAPLDVHTFTLEDS